MIVGDCRATIDGPGQLGPPNMSVSSSAVFAVAPALALSFVFLPAAAAAAAPATSATEVSAEQDAAEDDSEAEEDESETKKQRRPRRTRGLVIRGFGKAGTVGLPGLGFGGGLGVGWMKKRFRLDLQGSGQLSRTSWYPGNEVGGSFALWRAGLRGCLVLGADRVATPICIGGDGGMVTASGLGIDTPRTERQPWASVHADIDLAWHVLPTLAVVATSRWLVPLVRRQYYVGDRGTLVTTPPFGVEVGLGLELVLP